MGCSTRPSRLDHPDIENRFADSLDRLTTAAERHDCFGGIKANPGKDLENIGPSVYRLVASKIRIFTKILDDHQDHLLTGFRSN